MITFILSIIFLTQDVIPFKPTEEFEIKLDYQFKMRPAPNQNEFNLNETVEEQNRRVSTAPLPYLILDIEILKVSAEEERVRGIRGGDQFLNKRGINKGTKFKIDMGFTADMKDRVNPHEYILIFYNKKKEEISKIVIFIEEDGSFFVNGEKRGQF